ncbi:CMRF35-like molecule 2 isoform X1 [Marmota marmota marmota]|uniref:CMRF35-like molecule 2 isoform X1 n=1 Tax=Marmota marmota marmota TaxID=9994 RepID=UPI0020938CE7|nr:CMRF35-like molecule 2 isoform X1 [Marmota marmota marmota]
MWLSPALLLLCLPGCLSLWGPDSVTGTVGSSLSLQCHYGRAYKGYSKYWCRGQHDTDCHSIVETKGGEKVERYGRVSIRDSADDLTITVTIENLSEDDAGSYWCKIQTIWILDIFSRDPSFQVQVYVSPAATPTPWVTTAPITSALLRVSSGQNDSIEDVLASHPWSLLSSVHFLLLVFLKVPLLLSMLSAVLWVNRPQGAPGGGQRLLVWNLYSAPPQKCPA